MKLFKYSELENVTIDDCFDNDNWSEDIDNALNYGFDKSFPIIIDEDGVIIDGNHRFVAFKNENRLDEVVFVKVTWDSWSDLDLKHSYSESEELNKRFLSDDVYFYSQIAKIAEK